MLVLFCDFTLQNVSLVFAKQVVVSQEHRVVPILNTVPPAIESYAACEKMKSFHRKAG